MGTILSYDANGLCIDTLISINTITPDSAETTITIDTNFNDCRWAAMGSGTTKSLRDVFFLDASYGWAVGLDGYILSTTDGGQTWAVDSMYVVCQAGKERILHDFNTVFFVNHGSGWATGENGIGYRFVADSTCIDTFFAIDTTIDTFMVWDTAVTILIRSWSGTRLSPPLTRFPLTLMSSGIPRFISRTARSLRPTPLSSISMTPPLALWTASI
jgi:hypothetical protein